MGVLYMADRYVLIRSSLDSDPKLLQISTALGIPDLHALGALWKLWSWVDGLGLDGAPVKASGVVLDRLVGIPGFSQALRSVGWLDGEDGALVFPGLEKHSFKEVNKRERSADRSRRYRDAQRDGERSDGVTDGARERDGERSDGARERDAQRDAQRDASVTENEKTKPVKARKPRKEQSGDLPIPSELGDEFQPYWERWVQHRKEIKKPLAKTQAESQIKQLTEWGFERAKAAIEHTIRMGWQGLREPELSPQKRFSLSTEI
jgi:hypothetical protein